ncbi:MAG TPA: hypothetical protein DHU26_02220 [Spirochaetaceae bacterium]|nr:hypothetical protein [Spirochaetaceae bacterium]
MILRAIIFKPAQFFRALCMFLFLFSAGCALWAHDAWLYGREDNVYEGYYWDSIMDGEVPSFVFPLFGAELPRSHSQGEGLSLLSLQLATPSLFYDSPISRGSISSPPVPKLPELQRALRLAPETVQLDMELVVGTSISVHSDLTFSYRRDWISGQSSTLNWSVSDWLTGLFADVEFPRKAWVSYAIPGFGLAAGRFPSGIGAGHFGSTILNPEALFYDQVRMHVGGDHLRFLWMLGTSSAQLSAAEAEVQWRRFEAGDTYVHSYDSDFVVGESYWDSLNDHDFSQGQNALKLFNYHLLEWRPFDFLRVGITEFSVIGGTTPSFNFFLPPLLWHNVYAAGYSNVAMAGLLSVVPLPGLQISGEFLVDDTRATDEPEYAKPNSYAWQVSGSYSMRSVRGDQFTLGSEYSHVDKWTYVRWQPYLTFYQRQILPGGSVGIDYPLGYTYGPDSDQVGVWLRYTSTKKVTLYASWERVRKGPIYMGMIQKIDSEYIPLYYDYELYDSGDVLESLATRPDEIRNIITVGGKFPLGAGFSIEMSGTFGLYQNYAHVEGAQDQLVVIHTGLVWAL